MYVRKGIPPQEGPLTVKACYRRYVDAVSSYTTFCIMIYLFIYLFSYLCETGETLS
jgi:hypothetical protein